ncbi:MAG: type II secretion system protein GspG [Deltaproteobacteria bacterium RIFCSPLOWO2_12_FULL_60_19]|nr:MAG: type II secretion system protein GspG [Deltaproteobacteria bacterium RIFCSPLOWO2_12_FULL_60_19]
MDFPAGQRPKATDVSPWYGVYRAASRAGFTLVELLVVMVIIGLLAALVLPNYMGRERAARSQTARTQIELLGTALDTFRLDIGRYPTSEEGLDALRRKPSNADRWDGPYLKKEVPQDPWGKPYVYRSPGEHGSYDLFSYGADGVPGGDSDNRDILSWEG